MTCQSEQDIELQCITMDASIHSESLKIVTTLDGFIISEMLVFALDQG